MKKITLSGILQFEYDDWDRLYLIQEDGYKIDLVNKFQEAIANFGDEGVQVSYWLSDKPCTKNEIVEGWIKQFHGDVEAEYQENYFQYSSWTDGTDYNTVLTIGGHDLYNELIDKEGKFIIIEMNFKCTS